MGPAALAQVLRPLAQFTHPDLLVGLQTSDDAAVFRLSADQALVQTVDFFPPVVDDSVRLRRDRRRQQPERRLRHGWPADPLPGHRRLPRRPADRLIGEIFRGAADKVTEAGAVIAGGHTVVDAEPKYGLGVTGLVHPDRVWPRAARSPATPFT